MRPLEILLTPTEEVRVRLRMARVTTPVQQFMKRVLVSSVILGLALWLVFLLFFRIMRFSFILALLLLPFLWFLSYTFLLHTPDIKIHQRKKETDSQALFATRYLLVKLQSGVPLFNAMMDAAKEGGAAGRFFKEIVEDINMGKPIEAALDEAREFCPSKSFKLMLSQVVNSLKTGVDISDSLKKIVNEIAREHQIEIKSYSRKLNSVVMFYLILACIMPSLGVALFSVIAGFLSIGVGSFIFTSVLLFLALIQIFFVVIVRSIRPSIEL